MSALGSLVVKLALEYAQYTQGLDKSGQQALAYGKRVQTAADQASRAMESAKQSVVRSVTGIGASLVAGISVGAFAHLIKGAIDLGDELNKLSQKTGLSTETLSQWRYAAKLSDVSNESFSTSVRKLNVSIAQGLAGDKEKIAVFKALGITTADLGKGTEAVMLKIADAYAKHGDGAGKQENAIKLMGKAGDEMIPLLNGGSGAIRGMMEEANRLGLTISGDFAKSAEEFNDNLTRLKTQADKLAISLATDLVDGLSKAMQKMAEASIAGTGFFGVIREGMQSLFGGDDRHKANVAIVDLTDQILGTQNALDKARARGDEANEKRLTKRLAALNKEIAVHRNYAAMLDGEEAKAKAAAAAAEAARAKGPQIKSPGAGDAESEYDKLIKRIRERINLSKQELESGRELTEEEKFAAKVLEDLGHAKTAATAAQRAQVAADLAASAHKTELVQIQRSELELAKQIATQRQQARNTDYDQSAAALRDLAVGYDQALRSLVERKEALRDEVDAMRMAERQNITLAAAVELVAIARLNEKRSRLVPGSDTHKAIGQQIDERQQIAGLQTLKDIDTYLDPSKAQSFGDALKDSFGEAGNAIAQLSNALNDYGQKQAEIAKLQAELAANPKIDAEDRIKRETGLAKKQPWSRSAPMPTWPVRPRASSRKTPRATRRSKRRRRPSGSTSSPCPPRPWSRRSSSRRRKSPRTSL